MSDSIGDAFIERIAQRTVTLLLSRLDPVLLASPPKVSERAAAASEQDAYAAAHPATAARPATSDRPATGRPTGGTVTSLRAGKPASESQIKRLGDIRKADKLWDIIDAIVATTRGPGGDRVEQFDQLTFDEAQTALNTFYENSGGRRSAGGR